MPLYEYCCMACNAMQEMNKPVEERDSENTFCQECGYRMIRVLSAPAIQFKGGGFYSTGG